MEGERRREEGNINVAVLLNTGSLVQRSST